MKNAAFSLALIIASFSASAFAAPVTINNYSFEAATPGNITNATSGFNWTTNGINSAAGPLVQVVASPYPLSTGTFPFYQGNQAVRLYGNTDPTKAAYITQTTSEALAANSTYTLSLNIAPSGNISTSATTYAGFSVTLEAGTEFKYNLAASWTGSSFSLVETKTGNQLATASYTYSNTVQGANLTVGTYTTLTMTLNSASLITAGGNLKITLSAGNRLNSNYGVLMDNVQLTAVPEPSVVGALSLAGLAFGAYHIRRRARSLRK